MRDAEFEREMQAWLDAMERRTTRPCEAAEDVMAKTEGFDEWALVELMGHQRIAGRVTEAEIGGCKFVRVDVPASDGAQPLTKFLGPASIYGITPMSEESARAVASRIDSAPISVWDARRLVKLEDEKKPAELSAGVHSELDDEGEDDGEQDNDFH